MRASKWIGSVAALLVVATCRQVRTEAKEESAEAKLQKALHSVFTDLLTAKKGLVLGLKGRDARRELRNAAVLAGDRVFSLEKTQYAPDGDWDGTVRIYFDDSDPKEVVDTIQVVLVTGDYDKKKMGRFLIAEGRRLGIEIERDDEHPHTYWDTSAAERALWIGLGDGVIAIDLDAVEQGRDQLPEIGRDARVRKSSANAVPRESCGFMQVRSTKAPSARWIESRYRAPSANQERPPITSRRPMSPHRSMA